jgi:ribulose-5-phosphate 4-epimerase/fuculose-1-phosphate aldolase
MFSEFDRINPGKSTTSASLKGDACLHLRGRSFRLSRERGIFSGTKSPSRRFGASAGRKSNEEQREQMPDYDAVIEDLMAANRILAAEGVVDAFGHVSARHPQKPDRFVMSRARSPELVEPADIMEFTLEGEATDSSGRKGHLERFIHGGLYEARPDVQSVVHSHSRSVIPFAITEEKLRPVVHSSGTIGREVPVWDAQHSFGDTDLLVSNIAMGRDLARTFGDGNCALMRGHGCTVAGQSIREAVYTAYYLEANADLQLKASCLGKVTFLTPGEIEKVNLRLSHDKPGEGFDRAWEYWCRRSGVSFRPRS